MPGFRYRNFAISILLAPLLAFQASAQLVYQQQMDTHSAILPMTLDNNVYRIRAKPPKGVAPQEIICDIGITGTVLTDQRGTSASESGEKAVGGLRELDNIDVMFSDRVFTGHHTAFSRDRIIEKYDFDCGINIKYENKKKVAQVEIRVGYVLPSGDIEGLTWAKIRRKQRLLRNNIAKCATFRRDIAHLEAERGVLASSGTNAVELTRNAARISGIERQIARRVGFVNQDEAFQRDLAAFASLDEYLKTKIHGCQVHVHFHHDGKTLPVDIDDLKRSRVRPIQVFEVSKDPIKNAVATDP